MKHNILYSFRRCPYAIRARWALINTNQPVELREIDLKRKPSDLIKISKKATVPVLKTSANQVIDQSIDIMIWTIKRSNMFDFLGENSDIEKEEIFNLIETNDQCFKFHLDRFKYASRFNYQELKTHQEAGMEILISLNKRLKRFSNKGKSLFLVEAKETLADWAIWPFVRQFRIADLKAFDENAEIKYLRNWLDYFFNHRYYPIVMKKYRPWCKENKPIFFKPQD